MTHYILRFLNGRRFTTALSVLVVLFSVPVQAKRKDLVIMKNGDHLSGEVKKFGARHLVCRS
jgi:hypothetical protein